MSLKKQVTSPSIPEKYRIWIEVRKRYRLSDMHIQMARELGLNPKKFGGLANHRQEPWKAPLPEFIEELYLKRFGKERPEVVKRIEQLVDEQKITKSPPREDKTGD